jgi:hydrogenase small subunit
MREHAGRYLVVVDGAIPDAEPGYCTIAGSSAKALLLETVAGAAAVIALGSCAAFGGIPAAAPNPTGAVAVGELLGDRPLVNLPGCPPIPVVIAGVLAHFLAFGALPELDELRRPRVFYGHTIHDHCPRRGFYEKGLFAERFDDEGARQGWCLLKLGCKGPSTHNACATLKWNGGTSFPVQAGHGCIGCSEPGFWDAGGLYQPLFDGFFSAWMWWLRHPGGRRPPPAERGPSTPPSP